MRLITHLKETQAKRLVESCKENNCSLGLKDINPCVVVDLNKGRTGNELTETRCDRLVACGFEGNGYYLAVELSNGTKHLSEINKQLSAGAKIACKYGLPEMRDITFIAVFAGALKKADRKKYKELAPDAIVKFRNKKYAIEIVKCGALLKAVIKSSLQRNKAIKPSRTKGRK